jgi:tRNA A-37 threonylcarbamoyl transferase component Bud32
MASVRHGISPGSFDRSSTDDLAPREAHVLIAGRYEVINQLARGGMGTVYRAVDRLTGRVVTVKRLRLGIVTGSVDSAGLRATLAREFRLVAALRHPNVISVLDYGFDDDKTPFLVMDLEENARTIVEAGADAPLAVQVDLLVQTLRALVYLHRVGIIHRDLKPENILVVRGQVKVLDFGLSVQRSDASGDDGSWAGTPAYMAPEVLMGGLPGEQSDLFAVGMVACELFTGAYPLAGLRPDAVVAAILATTLPRSPEPLDSRLRPILERLLARDKEHRYRSARDVITDLGQALGLALDVETVTTRESLLQTAPLVGRERELARLEAALRDALGGHGSTWLVAGESGVGKSRVLDELRTRGLVEGAVVVRGQAASRGGSPYHPWRDVISTLLLRRDPGDADAEVLATIVPNVSALLGRAIGPPPTLDSEAAQTRLLLAVEQLFRLQPVRSSSSWRTSTGRAVRACGSSHGSSRPPSSCRCSSWGPSATTRRPLFPTRSLGRTGSLSRGSYGRRSPRSARPWSVRQRSGTTSSTSSNRRPKASPSSSSRSSAPWRKSRGPSTGLERLASRSGWCPAGCRRSCTGAWRACRPRRCRSCAPPPSSGASSTRR